MNPTYKITIKNSQMSNELKTDYFSLFKKVLNIKRLNVVQQINSSVYLCFCRAFCRFEFVSPQLHCQPPEKSAGDILSFGVR